MLASAESGGSYISNQFGSLKTGNNTSDNIEELLIIRRKVITNAKIGPRIPKRTFPKGDFRKAFSSIPACSNSGKTTLSDPVFGPIDKETFLLEEFLLSIKSEITSSTRLSLVFARGENPKSICINEKLMSRKKDLQQSHTSPTTTSKVGLSHKTIGYNRE